MSFLYNTVVFIVTILLSILRFFSKNLKLFVDGRKETFSKIEALKNENTIWIHAASLGEFEQARPIIEALKKEYKQYKILVTFFSPSGFEIRKDYNLADVVCYLPIDSKSNAKKFIEIVNPTLAIFIKYEFWPNFLNELKKKEIQEETKDRKLRYKVNSNLSYGFLKDRIISLLTKGDNMEEELKTLFKQHLIPIRPHRKNKRNYGKYRRRTKPKTYTNQKDTI